MATSIVRNVQKCYGHILLLSRSTDCICSYNYRHISKSAYLFNRRQNEEKYKGAQSSRIRTYKESYNHRKDEANRSIIIQIASKEQSAFLYSHCSKYGKINNVFCYGGVRTYGLVEFADKKALLALLKETSHFANDEKVPVESRICKLHSPIPGREAAGRIHYRLPRNAQVFFHKPPAELDLKSLKTASSLSSQIQVLYEQQRLSEVGTRLRYFVCTLIEQLLQGIFPKCEVLPFGSSVNGFGKEGCDLDMILDLLPEDKPSRSSLNFMTKVRQVDERQFTQQTLQVIGDILRYFMPQCFSIQKVLNARVPIVKFLHEATEVDCDLSMGNRSGVVMSQLLYACGELDPRVRPLVFAVRNWAQACELTQKNPGPWVSNFMLSLLVIHFLQTRPIPILPPLSALRNPQGAKDEGTSLDAYCWSHYTGKGTINKDNLGELLYEFFEFYHNFDVKNRAISIVDGETYTKPDFSPLYIQNPLEVDLNASKNVGSEEVGQFQKICLDSLERLHNSRKKTNNGQWGLTELLYLAEQQRKEKVGNGGILVKNFFEEMEETETTEESDSKNAKDSDNARTGDISH